jgi:hypothetical protein
MLCPECSAAWPKLNDLVEVWWQDGWRPAVVVTDHVSHSEGVGENQRTVLDGFGFLFIDRALKTGIEMLCGPVRGDDWRRPRNSLNQTHGKGGVPALPAVPLAPPAPSLSHRASDIASGRAEWLILTTEGDIAAIGVRRTAVGAELRVYDHDGLSGLHPLIASVLARETIDFLKEALR